MKFLMILIGFLLLLLALFLVLPNKLVRKTKTLTFTAEINSGQSIKCKQYEVNWSLRYGSFFAVHVLPLPEGEFFQKDTTYLSIPWNGQVLSWVGVGEPVSIRSYDGLLYMITWDRESNFHKIRYRYYKQDHDVLAEISWKDYPKGIAICNLGDDDDSKCLDDINRLKQTFTARIWYNLEYGKEYYEQPEEIDTEFLIAYLKKYKVDKVGLSAKN